MNITPAYNIHDTVIVPDGRLARIDSIHVNVDEFWSRITYFVRYDSAQFPLKDGYNEDQLRRRVTVRTTANGTAEGTVIGVRGDRVQVMLDGANHALWYPMSECEVTE